MKAALKWLVIGIVAVPVMLAVATFLWGYLSAPKPVPREWIHGLVKCVKTNTCETPRAQIRVNGREYWAVSLVAREPEVEYAVHYIVDDAWVVLMLTDDKGRMLLQDTWSSGIVDKLVEFGSDEKARVSRTGDPRFERSFLKLQELYYRLMDLADEKIVPKKNPEKKLEV